MVVNQKAVKVINKIFEAGITERNASPIIYMEQFFDEIRQGEPVERVMNRIASCIEKSSRAPFMNSGIDLTNYDSLKEHLAIKLVNTQANRKMLQEMPHENIEDLSAICYVDFPVDSREGKATMEIRNQCHTFCRIWRTSEISVCSGSVPWNRTGSISYQNDKIFPSGCAL